MEGVNCFFNVFIVRNPDSGEGSFGIESFGIETKKDDCYLHSVKYVREETFQGQNLSTYEVISRLEITPGDWLVKTHDQMIDCISREVKVVMNEIFNRNRSFDANRKILISYTGTTYRDFDGETITI